MYAGRGLLPHAEAAGIVGVLLAARVPGLVLSLGHGKPEGAGPVKTIPTEIRSCL
jgi:hypothetical protein